MPNDRVKIEDAEHVPELRRMIDRLEECCNTTYAEQIAALTAAIAALSTPTRQAGDGWRDRIGPDDRVAVITDTKYGKAAWFNSDAACSEFCQWPFPDSKQGAWLPIDSAPKDGSEFMTYIPGMEGSDAFDFGRWDKEDEVFWKDKCGFQYVTHWQPLPQPPQGGGGEVGNG